MLKKIFTSYLIISFMLAILTSQVTAYNTVNSQIQNQDKISALKFSFKILNQYVYATLSKIKSGEELTETELEHIRTAVQHEILSSLKELQKPEYQQVLFMLTEDHELMEQYANLTTSNIEDCKTWAEKACSLSQDYRANTLLGVPIGLVINLLAWVVYGIALLFEETLPPLGLFLYTISIIMTGVGWYFIL